MRIILDTNVVTSALLWRGIPHQLLQIIRQRSNLQLYSSAALLEELADVLTRPSLSKQLARSTSRPATCFWTTRRPFRSSRQHRCHSRCRDPDDDDVLALAVAAQADLIVSGDQDLLVIGQFEGIPIIAARSALEQFEASAP